MKKSSMFNNKRGQEGVSKLYPFILLILLVGMILGVGILTLEKFGAATSYTRTNYNDTVTIANYTAQDLDYGNITFVSIYANGTAIPSSCYSINSTDGHFIWTNETAVCDVVQGTNFGVMYDFKEYDTKTRASVTSSSTEIAKITTDWLGLIITVFVLALILWLVIASFGAGVERR